MGSMTRGAGRNLPRRHALAEQMLALGDESRIARLAGRRGLRREIAEASAVIIESLSRDAMPHI